MILGVSQHSSAGFNLLVNDKDDVLDDKAPISFLSSLLGGIGRYQYDPATVDASASPVSRPSIPL